LNSDSKSEIHFVTCYSQMIRLTQFLTAHTLSLSLSLTLRHTHSLTLSLTGKEGGGGGVCVWEGLNRESSCRRRGWWSAAAVFKSDLSPIFFSTKLTFKNVSLWLLSSVLLTFFCFFSSSICQNWLKKNFFWSKLWNCDHHFNLQRSILR